MPLHGELIFFYVAPIPRHLEALPFLFALPHQPVLKVDPHKIKQLLPWLLALSINGNKEWPLDRSPLIRAHKGAIIAFIKGIIYPPLILKADFVIELAIPLAWNVYHGDVESLGGVLQDGEHGHWAGTFLERATSLSYFNS
jgi:hypothetical protein